MYATTNECKEIFDRSKNAFWNGWKTPRLMLLQTPFKTQAVVEGFWLSRDSAHPYITQQRSVWAQLCRSSLGSAYNQKQNLLIVSKCWKRAHFMDVLSHNIL